VSSSNFDNYVFLHRDDDLPLSEVGQQSGRPIVGAEFFNPAEAPIQNFFAAEWQRE